MSSPIKLAHARGLGRAKGATVMRSRYIAFAQDSFKPATSSLNLLLVHAIASKLGKKHRRRASASPRSSMWGGAPSSRGRFQVGVASIGWIVARSSCLPVRGVWWRALARRPRRRRTRAPTY